MEMEPEQYWNYTPREFDYKVQAYNNSKKEKYEDFIYLAWHVEAFARQKKLPKLEKVLKPKDKKKQSPEEMEQMAKQLNKQFGGLVIEN